MNQPARRRTPLAALACLVVACALGHAGTVHAQFVVPGQAVQDRRVTLFGILATPGQGQGKDDPDLKDLLPQLRQLVPGHTFKLVKAASKNVATGGIVVCDLGEGMVASSQLLNPLDMNGKVQLRFELNVGGLPQFQTIVTTPPNQCCFINRMFPNGNRLIMGIGAR
jgi:hypothetical protein